MEVAPTQTYAIGSFEAKTHFAELLRKVESGVVVTITRNGHEIASMQRPQSHRSESAVRAWQNLKKVSSQIAEQNEAQPITTEDILSWKEDGRP